METFDEIVMAEAQRKRRALDYQKALGRLATVRHSLERTSPLVDQHAAQVKLLEKLEALAVGLKEDIQGQGGYLVRGVILQNVRVALVDMKGRLSNAAQQLATLQQELPRLEAVVAECEGEDGA